MCWLRVIHKEQKSHNGIRRPWCNRKPNRRMIVLSGRFHFALKWSLSNALHQSLKTSFKTLCCKSLIIDIKQITILFLCIFMAYLFSSIQCFAEWEEMMTGWSWCWRLYRLHCPLSVHYNTKIQKNITTLPSTGHSQFSHPLVIWVRVKLQ